MKEEEKLTNEEYKVLKEALKSNEPMTELKSKEQRALEIIKENKIEGLILKWDNDKKMWFVYAPHYENPIAYGYKKEEYDLLKEVML